MAPLKPLTKDAPDRRVHKVMDTAKAALKVLRERNPLSTILQQELDTLLTTSFPLSLSTSVLSIAPELDTLGCDLWNAATNLLRENETAEDCTDTPRDHRSSVVRLRTFAFLILDTAYVVRSKRSKHQEQEQDQTIRHFKLGLKACRFCLDNDSLDFALTVLERISTHTSGDTASESPLVRMSNTEEDASDESPLASLRIEFYLMRIMHAWKSDRLDLAEHFYGKIDHRQLTASASLAEKAADMYFEAGHFVLKKQNADAAIKWLRRALETLDSVDAESLSPDAGELRLTAGATLVEAYLLSGGPASIAAAQRIIEALEPTFGHRMVHQLMKVDVLFTHQPPDTDKLRDSLCQMGQMIVLTEHTFKILMQKIHHLKRLSAHGACAVLESFIIRRLLPDFAATEQQNSPIQEWIEKACITYTLFGTSETAFAHDFSLIGLTCVLDAVVTRGASFSPKATHAAQTLIWKAAGEPDADLAERWTVILRHRLFDGAGQVNKAKIGRKAMTLALARDDLATARQAFFSMPPPAQNDARSRYLAFKLALRSEDYELARESLDIVSKCADKEPQFLYACVLEAQQSSMRNIAVAALQALLDKRPPGVQFPSLLRYTARLLVGELESSTDENKEEIASQTVHVFETAAANTQMLKHGPEDQWQPEVKWWSKNAYNLALRLCADVHPDLLVRLLRVCTTFLDHFVGDAHGQDGVADRRRLCHFLCASALIVLARSSEEGSEDALNAYLRARKEIAAYKSLPTPHDDDGNASITSTTYNARLFELHKCDLECILQLKQWNDLDSALLSCLDLRDTDRWDTLADLLLIIHDRTRHVFDSAHSGGSNTSRTYILRLLDRIVNDTWKRQKDLNRAARWLRLSFSMALSDSPLLPPPQADHHPDGHGSPDTFAATLLAQAAGMAAKHAHRADPFPEAELQWLATTAFNRAIDILGASRALPAREAAEIWITAALELARYAADQGALHANLTGRREMIRKRMGMVETSG